jgi:hypothetical protein
MKEYQKQAYVCSMEQFNKLSEWEKQNRGKIFSRAVVKAERNLDGDELYNVWSRIYTGGGSVENGTAGDLGYLSKEAFEILESYYPDYVY